MDNSPVRSHCGLTRRCSGWTPPSLRSLVRPPLNARSLGTTPTLLMEISRTRFEHANPILRVEDMPGSLRYYTEVLGFTAEEWSGDDFGCVIRDGAAIYLSRADQGAPGAWVWIGVEDVEALYAEYQASGAQIRHPPVNYPWAYEMQVLDPDGHVLRFGSDPRPDIPFQ
jgi:predicted enzyme related to lactoylglutathione lyase